MTTPLEIRLQTYFNINKFLQRYINETSDKHATSLEVVCDCICNVNDILSRQIAKAKSETNKEKVPLETHKSSTGTTKKGICKLTKQVSLLALEEADALSKQSTNPKRKRELSPVGAEIRSDTQIAILKRTTPLEIRLQTYFNINKFLQRYINENSDKDATSLEVVCDCICNVNDILNRQIAKTKSETNKEKVPLETHKSSTETTPKGICKLTKQVSFRALEEAEVLSKQSTNPKRKRKLSPVVAEVHSDTQIANRTILKRRLSAEKVTSAFIGNEPSPSKPKITALSPQIETSIDKKLTGAIPKKKVTILESDQGPSSMRRFKTPLSEDNWSNALAKRSEGNKLVMEGFYEEAIEAYTCAIQLYPYDVVSLYKRAVAYGHCHRSHLCIKDLEKAVLLDASYGRVHGRLAMEYVDQQMLHEAKRALVRALQFEPHNERYINSLEVVRTELLCEETERPPIISSYFQGNDVETSCLEVNIEKQAQITPIPEKYDSEHPLFTRKEYGQYNKGTIKKDSTNDSAQENIPLLTTDTYMYGATKSYSNAEDESENRTEIFESPGAREIFRRTTEAVNNDPSFITETYAYDTKKKPFVREDRAGSNSLLYTYEKEPLIHYLVRPQAQTSDSEEEEDLDNQTDDQDKHRTKFTLEAHSAHENEKKDTEVQTEHYEGSATDDKENNQDN